MTPEYIHLDCTCINCHNCNHEWLTLDCMSCMGINAHTQPPASHAVESTP